jgi:hypothetical protein
MGMFWAASFSGHDCRLLRCFLNVSTNLNPSRGASDTPSILLDQSSEVAPQRKRCQQEHQGHGVQGTVNVRGEAGGTRPCDWRVRGRSGYGGFPSTLPQAHLEVGDHRMSHIGGNPRFVAGLVSYCPQPLHRM